MKRMKCYIYTRVSTSMQVDGYSLDAQKDKLRKYAEFQNMLVAGEYCDEGKSGKNIEGRPEFLRMLRDIESGKDGVSFVLVFKLSRFGRNAADVLTSLQRMQDFGVNLICVEDGIDSSKDSGKLMISVLSAVAEIERENILVQTMEGRRQKAREGKWNGGFAPYGYKLVDGQLQIAEEEAEVIRIIYDKYIHTTMGTARIANWLNEHVSHFIPALRAGTGNNHQRCIAVSIVSVGDGIRNIRRLHFCRLCAVKGQQTFVDIKARLLHAIFQRGFRHTVLPRTARARATAAHHDVGSTEAEHGHLRRRTIQRQHTVILEQHKALFTHLNIQRLCRRAFLRQIREISVVLALRKHKTRLCARHRHQRFLHRAFRKRRRNRRTQQRRAAENRQPLGNRSLHVSFLLLLIDCLSAIIG